MQREISERALFQRLQRHLAKNENIWLRKCRSDSRAFDQLGTYYTTDIGTNVIIHRGMELQHLEDWAREKKLMHSQEKLMA